MSHFVLLVVYDGTSYFGWQKTKQGPSIEEELEKVLHQIFQEPISLQAASRTDRGVHAEGQVVDFKTIKDHDATIDLQRLSLSLNQLLPQDIRCLKASFVPAPSFHPTLDVVRKQYRYLINTGPVQLPSLRLTHWHLHRPLNRTLLDESAQMFLGTKDFRGLCNRRADLNEDDTIRTIFSIEIKEDQRQKTLAILLDGDHFLYRMARNIVGTMVWTAEGKMPISNIPAALSSRTRALAGVTAPAHGLCLTQVIYPRSPF
jgi:tRNA pseudouridine38-40 synthase